MLEINIPEMEVFNENTQEFETISAVTLKLEHSLISISKWESKWEKPFLGRDEKTQEQLIDYIRCMSIGSTVSDEVYDNLSSICIEKINKYINASSTATTFSINSPGRRSSEIHSSELIYYYMIAQQIPFECQKWHLNRLLTLLKICNIKNDPKKQKMRKADILAQNSQINAKRREMMNSKG